MQRDPGLQGSPIRRMRLWAAVLSSVVAGACGGGGGGGGSVTASATVTVTGAGGSSVVIPLVLVDSPGNAADARNSLGAVGYRYSIAKFEITAGQYVAFLNAVARSDPYGLYASNITDMSTWPTGPRITRSGDDGGYTYSVAADYADRPIDFISWGDAARFRNWLHNGQPTGPQGPATTERGSYTLDGATSDAQYIAVTRSPGATYVPPTENEWYKAAYFEPGITAAAPSGNAIRPRWGRG